MGKKKNTAKDAKRVREIRGLSYSTEGKQYPSADGSAGVRRKWQGAMLRWRLSPFFGVLSYGDWLRHPSARSVAGGLVKEPFIPHEQAARETVALMRRISAQGGIVARHGGA